MMKSIILRIAGIALLLGPTVEGAAIVDQNTGLPAPDTVIDFGNNEYPIATIITNQYSGFGVTFGADYAYRDGETGGPAITQGYLQNTTAGNQPGEIFFTTDVTAAAFSYTSNIANTTFSAYKDGSLVEQFTAPTSGTGGWGHYFGFTGIVFDEIRMSIDISNTLMTVDNLQYNVVPEPASAMLAFASVLLLVIRRR